jgi:protein ImuA
MATHAAARETFAVLRHAIARIEGRIAERFEPAGADDALVLRHAGRPSAAVFTTGSKSLDRALGGGVDRAGLTEIHSQAMRDSGAAAGFALGLVAMATVPDSSPPLLWIASREVLREAGRLYAPGLAQRFGLAPSRLLMAEAAKPVETLWIAEEAAGVGAFCAIVLEIAGSPQALDLTATRRLHRRALTAAVPLFLLRQSGTSQPTAAPTRLSVAAAPSGLRHTLAGPLAGSIGPPAAIVSVGKSRAALPASVTLEWNNDAFIERSDPALSRPVVPLPAGGAGNAPPLRQIVAFPGSDDSVPGAHRLQPARKQHTARYGARRAG